MHSPPFDIPELRNFSGTAPLFPLPTVCLLPHASRPLHIFEQRYRQMTADALAAERLAALAVLQPDWEARYEDRDLPVFPSVCLGRISLVHEFPDGRSLVMLQGLTRARMISECDTKRPYRTVRLEIQPDVYPQQPTIDRLRRRRELTDLFFRVHPGADRIPSLSRVLEAELSLGSLCDVFAAALELSPALGLEVLGETNVDLRSDLLLEQLKRQLRGGGAARVFPPAFSIN